MTLNGKPVTLSQASTILTTSINAHHTLWRKALTRHARMQRREQDERDGTIWCQLWAMIRGRL